MPEDIDHIEELQKRLYARDPNNIPKQKYGILRPIKENVTSTWGSTQVPKEKGLRRPNVSGYRRLFIFSLIFFILAAGIAAFSVYRGAVTLSSKNVDLTILGNSFVGGGEELPIQVEIANKNSTDLVDTKLELSYPKGATDETGSEVTRITEDLGTVTSGKTKSVAFSAILYGEQGLSRTITATLSYHLAGSTATFEKTQTFSVTISSSPITLTVDGPSVAAADQPFELHIRSVFQGDQPLSNAIVRVEYPNGFTFASAVPAPSAGNNAWALGTLEKGKESVIVVRGRVSGIEGDEKAFRVYLGTPISTTDSRIAVSYNSALHPLTIEAPFVAADLSIDGTSGDVVPLPMGSSVNATISWRNNTNLAITNPTFTIALSGEDIDTASVKAINGYYDPLLRILTWTATSDGNIARIDPGESGVLSFSLAPKGEMSRDDITASLSVSGTIPDLQNEIKSITDLDEITVRYASRIQFAAQAVYSIGAIKNTGPYPPKANQETTYTLQWTARPSDNPLANMVATAKLPTNVVWAGVIMPQEEAVTYNTETREVRWNVGSLPRATTTPLSKTVSFQVKVRPSQTDVGNEPLLLSETTISATDTVANVPLSSIRPELTTRLFTDPVYGNGAEKVIP
jgi:hypothetical protein